MSRVLLITGGSRGIGAAIARAAARDGWQVAISYRTRADEAQKVADECAGLAVQADVTVEADVLRLCDTVDAKLGTPYGFVNNAGILPAGFARVETVAAADVREMFEVNSVAAFVCAREAARRMVAAGRGVIVNMSSRAAVLAAPDFVHYAASKAAVDALTVGLSNEVAAQGVRVVGIRPGLTNTDIHHSGGDPERPKRMVSVIPMQRIAEPEEIAVTALWLLSNAASYVTGTTIDVSGGR